MSLRDSLMTRHAETVKKALAKKPKPPAAVKKPASTVGVLQEILAFLKNYKPGPDAPKFKVTERDENGKVKSFKVES